MTHDNTSAVMKKFQTIGAKNIHDPKQLVFALDHDIQNKEESNLDKYQAIEGFARHHGMDFYPAGSGIGHQIMVEQGYVLPGFCGGVRFALQHVRRAGGGRHADRAHRRCGGLGYRRFLVADSAIDPGGAGGETSGGRNRQRRHHHPVRALQPRGGAERSGRVQRAGRGLPFHGCAVFHLEHVDRMGTAGGLVSG